MPKTETDIKIKWNFKKQNEETVLRLSQDLNINPLIVRILINRGHDTREKITKFFSRSPEMMHDPFLLPDMDKAVERIHRAVTDGERIMIYGDYDVDGISATCALYFYLRKFGADIFYYIPNRFEEGYGINKEALKKAVKNNIKLIVTVDTGIAAVEETEYAKSMAMDIVITDHHECPQILPEADALVNPRRSDSKYPFRELAGVGVAFKLICAYNQRYNRNNIAAEISLDDYFEFAAMGTIADIMPLSDENRILTYIGLKSMGNSRNYGTRAILECCTKAGTNFKDGGKDKDRDRIISAETISYGIAPRINAAGRLDRAGRAVELFMSDSAKGAEMIADELSNLNRQRQIMEKEIFLQAVGEMKESKNKIAVLYHEDWNQGVIGIVASKLTEKYEKAVVLLTKEGDGICKGSCRSIKNINITEALRSCSDLLIRYGGHELAAGLTIKHENIEKLEKRLNQYVDVNNISIESTKIYDIDCAVDIGSLNLRCIRELSMLEPFGVGNPVPIFAVRGCEIISIIPIGDNKHLKLILESGKITFEALNFNVELQSFQFREGDIVDIICNAGINNFFRRESVQFILRDIRYNKSYRENYIDQREKYKKFHLGGDIELDSGSVPKREDFKTVYMLLLRMFPKFRLCAVNSDIYKFRKKLCVSSEAVPYFKFRIILDIFSETGILDIDYYGEHDIKSIKINQIQGKINLEESQIYKRLAELSAKNRGSAPNPV